MAGPCSCQPSHCQQWAVGLRPRVQSQDPGCWASWASATYTHMCIYIYIYICICICICICVYIYMYICVVACWSQLSASCAQPLTHHTMKVPAGCNLADGYWWCCIPRHGAGQCILILQACHRASWQLHAEIPWLPAPHIFYTLTLSSHSTPAHCHRALAKAGRDL